MKSNDGVTKSDNAEMMIKVLSGLAAVLYSLRTIQAAGNAFGYLISLFTAYYKLSYIFYLLGSILALLSCAAMSIALILFAWRRNDENSEYMFLVVCAAGIIRAAAIFLRMILTYIGRISRGSYFSAGPVMTFVKEVIYAAITVIALFAVLYTSGCLAYEKKSKDELTGMLRNLPKFLKAEISKPSDKSETITKPAEMRTDRNYIMILVLGLITGGIYLYYIYYTMTKDLDIICCGDKKSTVPILPHILLNIATLGLFEFYWQYSAADRMAGISPRYDAGIKENGRTVLVFMIAGTFVFFLGTYFAMYFQIRNLNRLSEAYNRKMFGTAQPIPEGKAEANTITPCK